ncbi:MAG: PQQ-binding-like beta-propeller repeat protein [Planctomycetota bacterium]
MSSLRTTLAIVVLWGLPSAGQDHWPSFRNGGSSVTTADGPPMRWSPESGIAWQVDLPGYGQSSPVIWNKTAYLTSSDGPWQQRLLVHAIETTTGDLKWTRAIEATSKVENYFRNSRAAPTCVVDDHRVISFFASGDVTSLDHDGNLIWSTSLVQQFGAINNERGAASSLAQDKAHVFVLVDHDGPSYIVALDKTDGRVAWKRDRGHRVPSWASPVVVDQNDPATLVVSSADSVAAYHAGTGDLLWERDQFVGNHIASATVSDQTVYTGSSQMFHQRNVDETEIAGSNCRIDLNGDQHHIRWGADKANAYYASPLAFANYVYYVNKVGILYCVRAETGQQVFAKRIGNPCWASPIGVTTPAGDRYVYLFTKNGFTLVLRPGDDYDQLSRNQLWDTEAMRDAAAAAKQTRYANTVPADEAPPKSGPEAIFTAMPEAALHSLFSYNDPTVYGVAFGCNCLFIRTGQQLFCVTGQSSTDESQALGD